MMFQSKTITTTSSLGERLARRREGMELELSAIARATNISADYLEAIEKGNYCRLPGTVYTKNFLRVYASYLGLVPERIIEQYMSEQQLYKKTRENNTLPSTKPVERVLWSKLLVTPRIVRAFAVIALAFVCIGYLGTRVLAIAEPPTLEILGPTQNMVTSQGIVEIVGETDPEAQVRINGQVVFTNEAGEFKESVVLHAGSNVIEISSESKHGKQVIEYRRVVVTQE